jgi:hypothetical protein
MISLAHLSRSRRGADISFEGIALRFLEASEDAALEAFLEEKLRLMEQSIDHTKISMQQTMLCTWLLELYLQRLIRLSATSFYYSRRKVRMNTDGDRHREAVMEEHDHLKEQISSFVLEHRSVLDETTTLQLLASHGQEAILLNYATLVEDSPQKFELVVAHYARRGNWREVLTTLDLAPFVHVSNLFYKYSLQLIENIPEKTVEVCVWCFCETFCPFAASLRDDDRWCLYHCRHRYGSASRS